MTESKVRLALDMYVLAQGVKTGVYRVCDELFPRLVRSGRFETHYVYRSGDDQSLAKYLVDRELPQPTYGSARGALPSEVDIFLSSFGVAEPIWHDYERVLRAHVIYDLVAIPHPEFFEPVAASEVHQIIASLDEHTVIFAISESTKRDLIAYRPDLNPSQVTVIPLAAGDWFKPCNDSAELARVRQKYGIPAAAPYVLSLATLEIRKNLHQVVKSFLAYLERSQATDMHLVMVGMVGWRTKELDRILADAGRWRHRIILAGFVDDSDLSAMYSGATSFIYLSRYEGFGLPLLEAMACGTPVISANNSSLPEVVGDAGLMFDCDDVDGVADAIDKVASSPELRTKLSACGIERARLFSWDLCADIVGNTLSLAQYRHAELLRKAGGIVKASDMRSKAWPRDESGAIQASPLGYMDGSEGPEFPRRRPAGAHTDWPNWRDRLSPGAGNGKRIEGGLRTGGHQKEATPENPLVSYVTVVRNNTETLSRAIESVQRQTYKNVEHIVLDGASTDGTLALIEGYADRIDYFASEPDRGLYDALNKAIPLARGQLICVLNSDDWLEPSAAEIAVKRLRGRHDATLLFTAAAVSLPDNNAITWAPAFVHPGSYFTCANDCHNAIYATRAAYEASGPYNTSYKIAADFRWIMSCLDAGVRNVYTREITVNYSLGGVSSDLYVHSMECIRIVRERFPMLLPAEAHGLHHSFFTLHRKVAHLIPNRPDNSNVFISGLLTKYSNRDDFVSSVAWALAGSAVLNPLEVTTGHGDIGAGVSDVRLAMKGLLKATLKKNPTAYALARKLYPLLRKR
ncbi:glycosyltransferase [Bradyrhizobium cenepequi]|uniref:glycosyltransferase n=1 Tax=Bradyrhizobium cenepequi TaxID=2821403 RepID=UPI001CE35EB8|nr:glycosyltransferase [Bradyrhizobium cenepequi]MCA6106956.1 glycosyltransferase [Bradyrhizobium cenepequi]